jgi:hypothetical protein
VTANELIRRLQALPAADLDRHLEFVVDAGDLRENTWVDVVSIARADETDLCYSKDPETTVDAVVVRFG